MTGTLRAAWAMQCALDSLSAGRLADAEAQFRGLLAVAPGNAEAHFGLAEVLTRRGQFVQAVAAYREAHTLSPDDGRFWGQLVDRLIDVNRLDEARRLVAAPPRSVRRDVLALKRAQRRIREAEDAQGSDGVAGLYRLFSEGRIPELIEAAGRLIEANPANGDAWKCLGTAHLMMRDVAALTALERAAELLPDDPWVQMNLGTALRYCDRPLEAATRYRAALRLDPTLTEALANLGQVLIDGGKLEDAAATLREYLLLQPDDKIGWRALSDVSGLLGDASAARLAAKSAREAALRAGEDGFEETIRLATQELDAKNIVEAKSLLAEAASVRPTAPEIEVLAASLDFAAWRIEEGLVRLRHAARTIGPSLSSVFMENYLSERTGGELRELAKAYRATIRAEPYKDWPQALSSMGGPVRVGIVSGDIGNHVVSMFLESFLPHLDPQRVEIHAYVTNNRRDRDSHRLNQWLKSWRRLTGLTPDLAARRIRQDGIHVLIDLAGFTAGSGIDWFAYKPAPVQVGWLGYCGTTGFPEVDYILGDSWVLPEAEEADLVERPWRLPETFMCYKPPEYDLPVASLPALESGRLTFGSFNNLYKVNAEVIALWSRVLQAVPGSRLLLKAGQLAQSGVRRRVLDLFANLGVSDACVEIVGHRPTHREGLADYSRVDIALDTFPYTGATTSFEASWMGVPVLTLRGRRFLSHVSETVNRNLGLADWVAEDTDAYVQKAVLAAQDLSALARTRSELRERFLKSPLCDGKLFARRFEDAMHAMREGAMRTRH